MTTAVSLEILFILLLVAANGLFAMSEMALVSARKARLQRRAAEGDAQAQAALSLSNAPDQFLSTIQIGITLVGILAGAFGGATISEQLAAQFARVALVAPYAEPLALSIVVLSITYLSLVIGELVPKRLALNNPEAVAARVARPMRALTRLTTPFVRLLNFSTYVVLKILRVKPTIEPPVTEEEIKLLIHQGTEAGVFEQSEREIVESVFRLGDRRLSTLMTPRLDIVWLDVNATAEEVRRKVAESRYSRLPVAQGGLDNLLGVVATKDLLVRCLAGEPLNLRAAVRQPLFVPEGRTALQVLELFRKSHTHLALVIDEYGAVEGLVTMNDVLEAMVGDMPAAGETDESVVRRDDGSWLLDGAIPIEEFKELFPVGRLPGEERGAYHTLAGFMLFQMGRLPRTADFFEWQDFRFEVVDMDGKRIDKVLVQKINPDTAEG